MLQDVDFTPREIDPAVLGRLSPIEVQQIKDYEVLSRPKKLVDLGVDGIYSAGFNMHINLRDMGPRTFEQDYPQIEPDNDAWFSSYGVCDSPRQLLNLLPKSVKDGPRKFCISVTNLKKSDESPEGGWRWHKWGPYIGTQDPQCEYLYDEPNITEVWVYSIYEL